MLINRVKNFSFLALKRLGFPIALHQAIFFKLSNSTKLYILFYQTNNAQNYISIILIPPGKLYKV